MPTPSSEPLKALIVALPQTAGSALYGMLDVLAATGNLWQQLVGAGSATHRINVRIISESPKPFECGNGIPVKPDCCMALDPQADIIILPELWLGPDEQLNGRYDETIEWVKRCYARGSFVYAACSGTVLLAASGLLNGRSATSHWGYERMFRTQYPEVDFKPEPILQFADQRGRIVTAGGTTSWHDLAIHIIARHCSPGEALQIAKVYLLKTHGEGQLPYTPLIRAAPHADSVVRTCETLLNKIFREDMAIGKAVEHSHIPERSLKRRFKQATGLSLIDYVQNLRVEEAKRMLESSGTPIAEISADVGYDNTSFFSRLFKQRCGLTPAAYRRMFQRR